MAVTLIPSKYKRDRNRGKNIADVFNNASSNLKNMLHFAIAVFFTPALMASSLISQEIILMIANITLCLGFLINFCYRVYNKDIGKVDLILSLLFLGTFVAGAYFLFPGVIATTSLLSVIALTNQLAVGINLFFLLRDHIIPPILYGCKELAKKFGYNVSDRFYRTKELSLEKEPHMINALLKSKHFNSNIDAPDAEQKLNKINKLIEVLETYTNKYIVSFMGSITKEQAIKDMQGHIEKLTLEGNPDSSYTFIRKKIAFKEVKQSKLNTAKKNLQKEPNWDLFSTYFTGVSKSNFDKKASEYTQEGLDLIEKEYRRQKNKIIDLSICLP